MKVGYVRVSTEDQNTSRQEVLMKELCVDKIFIDKASGKNQNRIALKEMLAFIREDDIVIVESYSRLARSTRDLLDIVDIIKEKKAQFISRKEQIDTTTPAGRLMLTIFAGLYQFERECTLERQAEGIKIAKAEGKYKGRKPIKVDPSLLKVLYKQWKADEISAKTVMRTLNLNSSTFYRRVKEFENTGLV